MKRLQAYKYKLRPNGEQRRKMMRFPGSCRFVWNRMLALQKGWLDGGEFILRYKEAALLLPTWKHELSWLKTDAHSQALQQTLKSLDRALMDAFDKESPKQFPRFKRRSDKQSFRLPQGFKLDQGNSRIYLPKIGWVRYRNSRKVQGKPKNVAVSLVAGNWFVSIQTEREVEAPVHQSNKAVGIDVGISRFATLSDGSFVNPLNSFKKHERKLAKEQRNLARKVKRSNNRKKQKAEIAKLHHHIANVRSDFLHKTSSAISKNHAVVVLEDLQVTTMSASAKGTKSCPGKNVKRKRKQNKAILDQGWFEFRRQLEYKLLWQGGMVIAVDPRNTSRTCTLCGHIAAENRKSQATFKCVTCGYTNNADLVAAQNILAAGHAVAARGEMVQLDHSMKQEPPEAIWA